VGINRLVVCFGSNELEELCKEELVAQYEVLFVYLPARTAGNDKKCVTADGSSLRIETDM
jgi:hypothetical protein